MPFLLQNQAFAPGEEVQHARAPLAGGFLVHTWAESAQRLLGINVKHYRFGILDAWQGTFAFDVDHCKADAFTAG